MVFRYIRQMSNAKREKIRTRLSIVYGVIAWNGFAFCLYSFVKKQKHDSGLPPGLYEAALSSNTEKVKIIRFDGLSLLGERTYNKEEIEEARHNLKMNQSEDNRDDF